MAAQDMVTPLERDLTIASSESFLGSQASIEYPGMPLCGSDEHPAVARLAGHQGKQTPDVGTKSTASGRRIFCTVVAFSYVVRSFSNVLPRCLNIDLPLLVCFALWYAGNYYYNITNWYALEAAGGVTGFPMTIATLQLGVGCIYAIFLWVAPDARKRPAITFKDYVSTLPVAFMAAGAHVGSVFALSAGDVAFAQIVKAAEPAFAAVVGTCFYGITMSTAKWLVLIPVIGGVILASAGELYFSWDALITASIANIFLAIKANENKKLLSTEDLAARMCSVGNQVALTTISAFMFCLPLMFAFEGWKLGAFLELCKTTDTLRNNLVFSGVWFYLYNEVATLTIKKTSAVTQSVANTARGLIVIIVIAFVMGEHLGTRKLIGCTIGIGGVLLYSIIDTILLTTAVFNGSSS